MGEESYVKCMFSSLDHHLFTEKTFALSFFSLVVKLEIFCPYIGANFVPYLLRIVYLAMAPVFFFLSLLTFVDVKLSS